MPGYVGLQILHAPHHSTLPIWEESDTVSCWLRLTGEHSEATSLWEKLCPAALWGQVAPGWETPCLNTQPCRGTNWAAEKSCTCISDKFPLGGKKRLPGGCSPNPLATGKSCLVLSVSQNHRRKPRKKGSAAWNKWTNKWSEKIIWRN